MFTAAPVTMAKTWKQPKWSPTDDWIKTTWCTHTVILVSREKEWNTPFAATRRGLEMITPSEVSQKEKDKHMISLDVESKIRHT